MWKTDDKSRSIWSEKKIVDTSVTVTPSVVDHPPLSLMDFSLEACLWKNIAHKGSGWWTPPGHGLQWLLGIQYCLKGISPKVTSWFTSLLCVCYISCNDTMSTSDNDQIFSSYIMFIGMLRTADWLTIILNLPANIDNRLQLVFFIIASVNRHL